MQRLRAYLNATYRLDAFPDRRLRIGRRAAWLERAHPETAAFGLLTAWNPGSQPTGDAANLAAQHALDADLARAGLAALPGLNTDATGAWPEPSRLVPGIDLERLDALARRYRQSAALHWRRGRALRLRCYHADWAAPARAARVDTRFVDWVACAGP